MLPADTITEILTNLAALNLNTDTAARVIAAAIAPLLRSADPEEPAGLQPSPSGKASRRQRPKPRRAPRRKRKKARPRQAAAHGAKSDTVSHLTAEPRDAPRQRAIAALKANPGVSLTKVAAIAGCSRSTVANAERELGAEAHKQRKQARREAREQTHKQASKSLKPETIEHRARAKRFLKDTLADGPKRASDVEEAADRAHIDAHALAAARTELGVVTSRGNAGGVQAVQWSLPA